jgi:glycosyltransferase involved in cell wall biosynthesis
MIDILFVHAYPATFTISDLELLRERYHVSELWFRRDTMSIFQSAARAFVRSLSAKVVFCWFGSFHALIPVVTARILGRTAIVVTAGYDSANMPELGYGNMQRGIRRLIGKTVFRLASVILATSEFSRSELLNNVGVSADKVKVVYPGFEPIEFNTQTRKQKVALCVGMIDKSNLVRKGMETFVRAAKYLPDVTFVLAGKHLDSTADWLKTIATANVIIPGYVADLTKLMLSASVIVQVSAHEGFGCAIAEAMLCGCIPVVTNRGSLPEVVGDTGVYVPYDDAEATASAIQRALNMDVEARLLANRRVREQFLSQCRQEKLYSILDCIVSPQGS